jgi:glutamine amidotransferase
VIGVVNTGLGNVASVLNMFRAVGAEALVVEDRTVLRAASKLVLPGVGSFDAGMSGLRSSGLLELLTERVLYDKVPILGLCLGMQLFSRRSEEGTSSGLGWIEADVTRLTLELGEGRLKLPHMGWNTLAVEQEHPLLSGFDTPPRFYFVHSYQVCCERTEDVIGTCMYGSRFVAALAHGNIMGTQFHPEKSHKFGMRLLRNFAELV